MTLIEINRTETAAKLSKREASNKKRLDTTTRIMVPIFLVKLRRRIVAKEMEKGKVVERPKLSRLGVRAVFCVPRSTSA